MKNNCTYLAACILATTCIFTACGKNNPTEEPGDEPMEIPTDPADTPFTITSIGENYVSISKQGYPYEASFEYKVGKGEWSPYETNYTIRLADGEYVQFRNIATSHLSKDSWSRYNLTARTIDGTITASGNIMSLLDHEMENVPLQQNEFICLFEECDALIDASGLILPATTLAKSCYSAMFGGCIKLAAAPELPATTLAEECYDSMFWNCESITAAPELPATRLEAYCYNYMFQGCEKLSYVKAMFTDNLAHAAYDWLDHVAPTGTFVKNKDAKWKDADYIPTGWTVLTE